MHRYSRYSALALTATLSLGLAGVAGADGGASHAGHGSGSRPLDSGDPPDLSAQEVYQESVEPYTDGLLGLAQQYSSYTDAVFDGDAHSLVVLGTGSAPPDVAAMIASAPAGYSVSWSSVPYTSSQLTSAIAAEGDALPVMDAYFAADDAGIVLGVDQNHHNARWRESILARARQIAGNIPVRIVDGVPSDGDSYTVRVHKSSGLPNGHQEPAQRGNDTPPFSGADRVWTVALIHDGTYRETYCSTGFGIFRDDTSDEAMTSADHCSDGQQGWDWDNRTNTHVVGISQAYNASEYWDVQLMQHGDGGDADYWNYIWDGDWTRSQLKLVNESRHDMAKNEFMCVSGADSGSICTNKILQTNYFYQINICAPDGTDCHPSQSMGLPTFPSTWMGPPSVVTVTVDPPPLCHTPATPLPPGLFRGSRRPAITFPVGVGRVPTRSTQESAVIASMCRSGAGQSWR